MQNIQNSPVPSQQATPPEKLLEKDKLEVLRYEQREKSPVKEYNDFLEAFKDIETDKNKGFLNLAAVKLSFLVGCFHQGEEYQQLTLNPTQKMEIQQKFLKSDTEILKTVARRIIENPNSLASSDFFDRLIDIIKDNNKTPEHKNIVDLAYRTFFNIAREQGNKREIQLSKLYFNKTGALAYQMDRLHPDLSLVKRFEEFKKSIETIYTSKEKLEN
jgi:hypothetical protein